jgi:hypothetical protein
MQRQQLRQIDVEQLVPVETVDRGRLLEEAGCKPQPSSPPEALRLGRGNDLDTKPGESAGETIPLILGTTDYDPPDPGAFQDAYLVSEQRAPGDLHERLGPSARRGP